MLNLRFSGVRASVEPLHMAAILSLSGTYNHVGFMQYRALHTAERVVNAQGGILHRPFVLDVYDDHSNVGDALALARALVRTKREVAIVGGSVAATCEAIRTQTDAADVVQYCLSGVDHAGGTFFSSFPPPQHLFGSLPATFFQQHDLQRIAVVIDDTPAGAVYQRAVREALAGRHTTPVMTEVVRDEPSAEFAVEQALRLHADALYVGASDGETAMILRNLRDREAKIPVWLANAAARADTRGALSPYLPTGPVYTAGDAIDVAEQLPQSSAQRPALLQYLQTFQQLNEMRPDIYATVAADAMEFLVAGLRADGGVGGVRLARTIELTPPAMGLYSEYRFSHSRHDGAELPNIVVQYESNGSRRYVEQISG